MATKTFRFRLKIGSAAYVDSSPIWADDTAFVSEGQEGEMFFREKLNVKLSYLREDFDAIYAAAFDTEFRALFQQDVNGVWTSLWVGKFWYTDIEFDVDNRTCSVSPETFDLYEELLGGLEKEFNLIELEPPTVTVQMLKQAVLQIVLPGAEYIANYTNDGIFYETPIPSPLIGASETEERDNHNLMLDDYGFGVYAPGGIFDYARAIVIGDNPLVDVTGIYDGFSYLADGFDQGIYRRLDDAYRIQKINLGSGNFRIELDIDGGATVYVSDTMATSDIYLAPFHEGITLSHVTTPANKVSLFIFRPYVRLLTNETDVDGQPTFELPEDDPFPHGTFTHALPIETGNFTYSEGHGTTPTRWGKIDAHALHFAGEYFTKPSSTETLMPVAGTTWTGASAWFYLDDDLRFLQQEGSEVILIKDAYKLSDCIDKLLDEIQPLVGHSDSVTYSQFLYAAGTNAIRGSRKVPVIIPKSNVVVGEYDQPAQKAPIRLSEILQLLRYVHNCFWHISEGTLVIEHEHYYRNGKNYSTEQVGTDLTAGIEPKTELVWAYRTNKFKFEKQNMPERIETAWMDKGSQQFDGYPIQVNSPYAQKGNIERRQIAKFTADVDFIHVAANDISKEGFVFLECVEGEVYLEVPFVEFSISAEETYTMQNGYASLIYAHDRYHKYGLPAESVNLNKADITATTVKRSKMQEIAFATEDDIDPYELIETNIGAGRIHRMERPVTSNIVKAQIRHNNE